MELTKNIMYIDDNHVGRDSRVVGQTTVACNRLANKTQSIPIEFLSDNLSKVSGLEEQVGKLKDEIEWDNQLLQNAEEVKQRLQNEISNLMSDNQALNVEKSELENDIEKKQETIVTLTNSIKALQHELESVSVNNGTSVSGITLVVNGEEASVTTLTRTNIDQLLYDDSIETQEIWMWVKEMNENNQYYYNLIYKRVSSIEDIRQQFESTLSQDGSVYTSTFSTTFSTGEDFVVTSLTVRLPYQGVFAMSIPMINVNLRTNDTIVLFTTSSLHFNIPKSDDLFVPEVGW